MIDVTQMLTIVVTLTFVFSHFKNLSVVVTKSLAPSPPNAMNALTLKKAVCGQAGNSDVSLFECE